MDEKKHVGRPTNEEVANRKKKKVIKYSLITIVSILLVGGIALFLNRDNIDFSSLMGASIFKREKYVANYPCNNGNGMCYYFDYYDSSEVDFLTKCKVSNSKYADCSVDSNFNKEVYIKAKKSGLYSVKIYGVYKNGKSFVKTIKMKNPIDFKSPVCTLKVNSSNVEFGENFDATLSCNESIKINSNIKDNCNDGMCDFFLDFVPGQGYGGSYFEPLHNIDLVKYRKISSKKYKLTFNIPYYSYDVGNSKFYINLNNNAFTDITGNVAGDSVESNSFAINN